MKITVAGQVAGKKTMVVDQTNYTYPVVAVKQLVLGAYPTTLTRMITGIIGRPSTDLIGDLGDGGPIGDYWSW